jgi:N-acetylneuraminic acid mutarotase
MPTARADLAAATGADGRIYAIGGIDGSSHALDTVEVYTASSNTWSTVAPMPTARVGLAAASGPDGRIYAIGGFGISGPLNTVEAYTPSTNTWNTVAPMPTARGFLAATTGPDGRIYALGGMNFSASGGILDTVEAYTLSTNTWSTVAPMPTARHRLAAATGPDGRIYAIGGFDINGPLNTVEAYAPSTNAWSTARPMMTARGGLAVPASSGGGIYAIGGNNYIGANGDSFLNTVEAYIPSTDTWTTVAPMPAARTELGAVTGPDGRIYAIGGDSGGPELDTVEAYTPAPVRTGTPTVGVNSPTATTIPVSLTVHFKLGKKSVRPGQQQRVTVATAPGAQVTVTLTFPNHYRMQYHGTAGTAGTLMWRFTEPRSTVRGQNHMVKVVVQVHDEGGQTASATGRYTTG